jgi:hypothetical protein
MLEPMGEGIALEVSPTGEAMAWALPHAIVSGQGSDEERAVGDLAFNCQWYEGWRNRRGLPAEPAQEFGVVEVVPSNGYPETGDTGALLAGDREPLDSAFVEWARRLLALAREDVAAVVAMLEGEGLDDAGLKRVRWTQKHLARAEWWYASRIPGSPAGRRRLEIGEDLGAAMTESRAMFFDEFLPFALGLADRDRIFDVEGEKWTPKKAVRRAVWHDLYHLRQLEFQLTSR